MTEPTNEQLATWIERGLATPNTAENHGAYLDERDDGVCHVCALSLAAIGKIGLAKVRKALLAEDASKFRALVQILGIGYERANEIEEPHLPLATGGSKSAAEIAGMLRRGEI